MRLLLTFLWANLFIASAFAQYIDEKNKAHDNMVAVYKELINSNYDVSTLYCDCSIYSLNKHLYFDNKNCTYEIVHRQRGKRVEPTHIVPPSIYAKDLPCKNKCREENNKIFIKRDTDLHNIFPSLGEIISLRLNYKFVEKLKRKALNINFGSCSFSLDKVNKEIVPPDISRGTIARAYLYMEDMYKIKMSDEEMRLFNKWNNLYPPTPSECKRNQIIHDIQGNFNYFISRKCIK